MKLYRSLGRIWTGTQADAKAAQGSADFETIEVPTDKPSLLTWLNEFDVRLGDDRREEPVPPAADSEAPAPPPAEPEKPLREAQMERFEALARRLGWTPPSDGPAHLTINQVEDAVAEFEGNDLLRAVGSSIDRLGQVAGTRGWAAFARDTYRWAPGAKSVEQGMGLLMLSALKLADQNPKSSDNPSP